MVQRSFGRQLVWNVITIDTFAPFYILSASSELGAVAALTKERKKAKYISLAATYWYSFCPIAIETFVGLGPQTAVCISDLGSRLGEVTGEDKAHVYLPQRLVVAVMRSNAVSVSGTI